MGTIYSELLGYIHKYYSIGIPGLWEYPGQTALKSILEKKINSLTNEEQTPWSALIKSLREIFAGYELRDYGSVQFPNYLCHIQVANLVSKDVTIKTNLVINISLLCNYYTVFFEDIIRIRNYQLADPGDYPGFRVLSFNVHSHFETHNKEIQELKALMPTLFTNYSYLHHKMLFNTDISGGVPFGVDLPEIPTSYSIYRYLFDSYSIWTHFEVLD